MDRVLKNDDAATDRIPVDHKRWLQKQTKCTCSKKNVNSFSHIVCFASVDCNAVSSFLFTDIFT